MSLELFHETKEYAHSVIRDHKKLWITLILAVTSFWTFIFFTIGVIQQDPLYGDLPLILSVPLVMLISFQAVATITISFIFIKSFGVVSTSKIRNNFHARKENKLKQYAKAVYDWFNQYGQKDYSLQIDEVKQGFQYQLNEKDKEIKELTAKNIELENLVLLHIARQNKNQFDFNLRLKKLEQKKSEDIQTIGDKAQTNNNSENIDLKKFKEDL